MTQGRGGGEATKRAVIHIGIEKTGSTSIQRFLWSQRPQLLERGVLYPSLAANLSAYVGAIFEDRVPPILSLFDHRAEDPLRIPSLRDEYRASLEADLARPGWQTVVISAESLCDFSGAAINRLRAWLIDHQITEFRVLAYVRDPGDWTRSVIQQRLKSGQTLPHLFERPPRPNWRKRFTHWISQFGHSNVSIVTFEDARANGILATFCERAGISPLGPEPKQTNKSMSMEAALILSHLNAVRPIFENGVRSEHRRWLGTDKISMIPGSPFTLRADVWREAVAHARDDVDWLNTEFGLSLYPESSEPASSDVDRWGDQTLDAVALLLSDLGNERQTTRDLPPRPAVTPTEPEIVRRRLRALSRRFSGSSRR